MKSIEILEKLDREATPTHNLRKHPCSKIKVLFDEINNKHGHSNAAFYTNRGESDADLYIVIRNCLPEIIELVRAAETTEKARSQDAVFHAVGKLRHSLLALERKVSGEK